MGRAPPHHVGIIQILQHCGPETFQEESLLEVYRSCRALLVSCVNPVFFYDISASG